MSSTSVSRLIAAQLRSPHSAPPEWFAKAEAYAVRQGSTDLLALIAGADTTPPDVRTRLARNDAPLVRIAALKSGRLDPAVQAEILAEETRANVLAGAYQALCPADRARVLEKFKSRPTRALAEELLLDKKLPYEIGVLVVNELAPRVDKLSGSAAENLENLVVVLGRQDPEGLVDVLMKSGRLTATLLLSGPDLPDDAIARLITPLVEGWEEGTRPTSARRNPMTGNLLLRILRSLPRAGTQTRRAVTLLLPSVNGDTKSLRAWVDEPQAGEATLEELLERAQARDQAAISAILADESVDERAKLNAIRHSSPSELPRRVLAGISDTVRDALAAQDIDDFTTLGLWDDYADPRSAKSRVLLQRVQESARNGDIRPWGLYDVCHFVDRHERSLVRLLPCRAALSYAAERGGGGFASALAAAACEDLTETGWLNYYSLMGDWDGSLQELHDACNGLG